MNNVPEGKGKKAAEKRQRNQQRVLNRLLRIDDAPKKFRDPADMLKGGG